MLIFLALLVLLVLLIVFPAIGVAKARTAK